MGGKYCSLLSLRNLKSIILIEGKFTTKKKSLKKMADPGYGKLDFKTKTLRSLPRISVLEALYTL